MENPAEPAEDQKLFIFEANFSVSETIDETEAIGQVQAFHREGRPLTFSILSNDSNIAFEITSNNLYQRILSLSNGQFLDYDRATNHVLVVSVFDGELSNTATVTVQVRSNQAPTLVTHVFSISEAIDDTDLIAQVQASKEGEREVFTYSLLDGEINFLEVTTEGFGTNQTNNYSIPLFEINSSNGHLSLADGQVLDFELTTNHPLMVGVSDGEFSNTIPITLLVEDALGSEDQGYCGALMRISPVMIDGSSNAFFTSGDGTETRPYVLPVKDGCEDLTFIYDPHYTYQTTLYFQFPVSGRYDVGLINVAAFEPEDGGAWLSTGFGYTAQGYLSTVPVGFIRVLNQDITTNNNSVIIRSDLFGGTRFRSAKGIRLQKSQ